MSVSEKLIFQEARLNHIRDFQPLGLIIEADFPFGSEFYLSIPQGKKGVISAKADIGTRKIFGAALAHNNHSGFGRGAVAQFNTKIFGV